MPKKWCGGSGLIPTSLESDESNVPCPGCPNCEQGEAASTSYKESTSEEVISLIEAGEHLAHILKNAYGNNSKPNAQTVEKALTEWNICCYEFEVD
jgi:hypothetical protein